MRDRNHLYCVNWTEYERGWGQRPDGHTLYKDEAAARDHIAKYSAAFLSDSVVPDCYSKPGKPFLVEVTSADWDRAQEDWFWGSPVQHRSR